jgi:hypothetical protein
MRRAITKAASQPAPAHDYELILAYYGHVDVVAVWLTRQAVRRARQLGLYPSTAQLAHEAKAAA